MMMIIIACSPHQMFSKVTIWMLLVIVISIVYFFLAEEEACRGEEKDYRSEPYNSTDILRTVQNTSGYLLMPKGHFSFGPRSTAWNTQEWTVFSSVRFSPYCLHIFNAATAASELF